MKEQAERRLELKEKIFEIIDNEGSLPTRSTEQILMLVDEYTNEIRGLTKGKTLEERKESFVEDVLMVFGDSDYHYTMIREFYDYWTEHNEGGKKMRFEMSKNQPFSIKRRLSTWAKNQKKFNNEPDSKAKKAEDWLKS